MKVSYHFSLLRNFLKCVSRYRWCVIKMFYILVSSGNSSSKKNNRPKVVFFPLFDCLTDRKVFLHFCHIMVTLCVALSVPLFPSDPSYQKEAVFIPTYTGWKCPALECLQTSCWLCDASTPAVTKQLSPRLFPLLYAVFCLTLQGFRGNLWQEKCGRVWALWPVFISRCNSVCALIKPKSCCHDLLLQLVVMNM